MLVGFIDKYNLIAPIEYILLVLFTLESMHYARLLMHMYIYILAMTEYVMNLFKVFNENLLF